VVDEIIYKEVYEQPVNLENINHFRNAYNMLTQDQLNKASFLFTSRPLQAITMV
jgi:hypothetical protein